MRVRELVGITLGSATTSLPDQRATFISNHYIIILIREVTHHTSLHNINNLKKLRSQLSSLSDGN